MLKPGDPAPDFDLPAALGRDKMRVRLSQYRGHHHVLLAFYPLDWTPT